MTPKEEEKYMQSLTTEELIACLRLYGCNPYYNKDYEYTVKEIERRLNGGKIMEGWNEE